MLERLAEQGSVEAFYRGDITHRIAAEFQKRGGLVGVSDLAAYQAREVEPLKLEWRGFTLRTAPLTAGGLTVFEALSILKAMDWDKLPASPTRTHVFVEALRLAWHDRLPTAGRLREDESAGRPGCSPRSMLAKWRQKWKRRRRSASLCL